jgi:hypothetical protein
MSWRPALMPGPWVADDAAGSSASATAGDDPATNVSVPRVSSSAGSWCRSRSRKAGRGEVRAPGAQVRGACAVVASRAARARHDLGIDSDLVYDRGLLLGAKRDAVLELWEVQRYGTDSFDDLDYTCIYGLRPAEWYAKGVRMLGRTVVECTRDVLAEAIGADMAGAVRGSSSQSGVVLIDLFAGSCNTLFWMAASLPGSRAVGFEVDAGVFELTSRNLSIIGSSIELRQGDYLTALSGLDVADDAVVVAFVAPPWGSALSPGGVLDLRRTVPPVGDVIDVLLARFAGALICAIQVYETTDSISLIDLEARLSRSTLRMYAFNAPGQNHGIVLGTGI